MTADLVRYAAAVGTFALFTTTHLSLVVGLALRPPRWRGALALLVPPLAPVWGYREGLLVRTALWAVSLVAYCGALWVVLQP